MTSEKKKIPQYGTHEILQSVQQSYNSFAQQWSTSRQNSWYEFSLCAKYLKTGDKVLDLGCGNGRFYDFLQEQQLNVEYQGIDNSTELIAIAKEEYPAAHFKEGSALQLPYEDNTFDRVVSFAVIHHITPKSNRQQFFAEIARVLKPGGTVFVTTWNIHQSKYKKYLKQRLLPKLKQYALSPFNTSFGWRDCMIPFGEDKTLRYIHGFTPAELNRLATRNFTVLDTFYTLKNATTEQWRHCRNLCVHLQKKG